MQVEQKCDSEEGLTLAKLVEALKVFPSTCFYSHFQCKLKTETNVANKWRCRCVERWGDWNLPHMNTWNKLFPSCLPCGFPSLICSADGFTDCRISSINCLTWCHQTPNAHTAVVDVHKNSFRFDFANFLEMCLKCVRNLDGKSKCKLQASGWVFPFFCTISESRHRAGYEPLLLYNINYSESSHYAIKTSLYFTWKIVRKLQHKESFCLLVPKVSEEQNEAHKFFYIRIHFINWLF